MKPVRGLVCEKCSAFAEFGTRICPLCGASVRPRNKVQATGAPEMWAAVQAPPIGGASLLEPLKIEGSSAALHIRAAPNQGPLKPPAIVVERSDPNRGHSGVVSGSPKSNPEERSMDQAKSFVCRSCSTQVSVGHKFCGRCGAAVPPELLSSQTQFFGQLQAPGKAKLILIRGEGVEGLSYQLNAEQHLVGRSGQLVFPDDPFVSPRHANFFYRDSKLVVKDEGSLNGVYVRVKGSVEVQIGDQFLAGEQVFRVDEAPRPSDQPLPDGTMFYCAPRINTQFRITQLLAGGLPGLSICARGSVAQVGREGADLNFSLDLFMSGGHCKLEEAGGKITLTDMNSRNGTYVRLRGEKELAHGDYVFIGKKLLRVEITAA